MIDDFQMVNSLNSQKTHSSSGCSSLSSAGFSSSNFFFLGFDFGLVAGLGFSLVSSS